MNVIIFMFIALVSGSFFPIQSAINIKLRQETSSPFVSGAISNLIGAVLMLVLAFLLRRTFPISLPETTSSNWWMWLGGVLSALIVTTSIVVPSIIGYGTYISIFLTGQLVMALLIDHFGLLGATNIPVHPRHVIGIILMILGILFIKK